MNSLFKSLNQGPMQMIQQIKQNPAAILSRAGLNVPGNLSDPNAIIQHLMRTGQVSQAQYDRVRQIASQFK